MNKPEPQFKVGDHVESRNSGKVYIVLAVWPSDETGCYNYAITGWRGGRRYGPRRIIGESGLRLAVQVQP
jgi:hypothetical protein